MGEGYRGTYRRWERDPGAFWLAEAERVDWHRKPTVAFDPSAGVYGRWFPDGECNTCHNALDRHVEQERRAIEAMLAGVERIERPRARPPCPARAPQARPAVQ